MAIFAVVNVNLNYDYIEGIECLASFDTEEEAKLKIKQIIEERNSLIKKRIEYIDKFINDIKVPVDANYSEWIKFINNYKPFECKSKIENEFKLQLRMFLRYFDLWREDYSPPAVRHDLDNLFIMEVKDND